MGVRNTIFARAEELSAIILLTVVLVSASGLMSGCATSSAPKNSVPSTQPARQTSLPAVPAGGYTWQQLVNLAVAANPDYAAILAKARAEYYRYKSRTDLKDPQLSLEYSYLYDEVRRDQFGAQIRLYIPNPFVNRQIIRTGEAARLETETGTESLKNEIASMIYELTQEILIGERELSVLNLREQVLSDWAKYLEMRYDARLATQADMHEFDIQRLRLKASIQQARFTTNAARRSLQVLVQIPGEQLSEGQLILNPFPSDWEAVLETLKDDEAFIEGAYSRSPELAIAGASYEKACATLDTARARQIPWFDSVYLSYSPTFSKNIEYGYYGNIISTDRRSDKWTLGLNMSLPVFSWFSSEKKMASSEIEAASLQITSIRERIRNDITGIITDLRGTLDLLADFQSTFDSIPEPTRETFPNTESFYKQLDARLSASENALKIEMQCAHMYSQLLKVAGGWE